MALNLYDVLIRPIITEKSTMLSEKLNQYVFEVALDANKPQIREAVETIFGKRVTNVRTLIVPRKLGRRGRRTIVRASQYKKAIVTLAEGETLELFNV